MERHELIQAYVNSLGLTEEELRDTSTNGRVNRARSRIGAVISEMCERGMIRTGADGLLSAAEQKPVIVRRQRCEREVLRLLSDAPMRRSELRDQLARSFGTDSTVTQRDDGRLYSLLGEIMKRLIREGTVQLSREGYYSLTREGSYDLSSREQMLLLEEDFLTHLHARGGEYFEHYMMNLLERYLRKHGRTVTESHTLGGANDGGIDGRLCTVDSLGFRETVLVQMKNRLEPTPETEVRAFYGAVCAARGTRGIFASTSTFHPSARQFLEALDDCVGLDGSAIFRMACEVRYGIRMTEGQLQRDPALI